MDLSREAAAGCGGCFRGWGGGAYRHLSEEAGGEGWKAGELLAGPWWKNYVRRFGLQSQKIKRVRLGYDAESYALNFDDGSPREDGDGKIAVAPVRAGARQDLSCKL
uniref:Uncharacterized protein n=1 Tax=Kalanchoe fedtschenkoi TaxID=63787 RepID=A0A7N0T9Y1_KALFE